MGLINPNQGTGNYTGIGPQTNFQAQPPMQPIQPMQPLQQMQQSPLQYNVNRARLVLAIRYAFVRCLSSECIQ